MNALAPALADTQFLSFISTFDSISLSKGRADLADDASDPQHERILPPLDSSEPRGSSSMRVRDMRGSHGNHSMVVLEAHDSSALRDHVGAPAELRGPHQPSSHDLRPPDSYEPRGRSSMRVRDMHGSHGNHSMVVLEAHDSGALRDQVGAPAELRGPHQFCPGGA